MGSEMCIRDSLDTMAQAEAEPLLTHPGVSLTRVVVGDLELIIEAWNPAPHLLIVGASDLAVAITRIAETLAWSAATASTSDAALAAIEQMSTADIVIVIEHDPFVATPVIASALRRGLGYVGALGSRRTQILRREHLADIGLRESEICRLRGPAGLDIGARTPGETAISIVAEIIASRSDRSGAPLASTTGRITG